jgi:hypothetical protein
MQQVSEDAVSTPSRLGGIAERATLNLLLDEHAVGS